MLLLTVDMLKKRLGAEGIEKGWSEGHISYYYKIPSSIIIPEGCKEIGSYAFYCCRRLKKVEISESVEYIGNWAFNGCEKAVIILKKPLSEFKGIASNAFTGCKKVKAMSADEIRSLRLLEEFFFTAKPC